jgi:hypothetical protein
MFQSIKHKCYLGYNAATKLYENEFELIDSDFSCAVCPYETAVPTAVAVGGIVIQEYSKRNLNVAANLIRCFKYQEKKYGSSIATQIVWAERYQHQFTPEIKAELDKYLAII